MTLQDPDPDQSDTRLFGHPNPDSEGKTNLESLLELVPQFTLSLFSSQVIPEIRE